MTAPMSDAEIREALARADRASAGPWLTGILDGPFSPETCAKYVEACLNRGALAEFWFVSCVKPDGVADVCHVGNGPTSPQNCDFLAHARTDVPRLAADLLAARAERDEARAAWKLTVERPTKEELRSALARAETAEARCRELEAERAIVADYLRDTDADFRARRPSERAVLDALLSPPPSPEARCGSRTKLRGSDGRPLCERHGGVRADFQQNDEPCIRVQPTPSPEATETWRDAIGCAPSPPGSISSEEAVRRVRDGEATPFEADTMTPEDAKCATCGHEERRHLSEDGDGARWCDVALCDCVDYAALEVNRG